MRLPQYAKQRMATKRGVYGELPLFCRNPQKTSFEALSRAALLVWWDCLRSGGAALEGFSAAAVCLCIAPVMLPDDVNHYKDGA